MINKTNLRAVGDNALSGPALQARQKSIINNAIRELLYAIGYAGPFRDNDMRVEMAVEAAIQHLEGPDIPTSEHSSLAPIGNSTSAVIDRISNILEKGLEDELLRDTPPIPVRLPDPNNVVKVKTAKDADPA